MNNLKRFAALTLGLVMMLSCGILPVQAAKTLTGDLESNPIILQQKQKKNSSIAKDGNSKYFKEIVTDTGNITVSVSSKELKKNGTLTLIYDDNGAYFDQTEIKYNKKTKTATATLTSSRIVMPGQYRIVVNTATMSKKTAFTITTKFKVYDCDDLESNDKEESAQKMVLKSPKKAVTYHMILSGETFEQDLIDQFTFRLKAPQKIKITASADNTDRIRILLKRKTDSGSETVNTKSTEQYFALKNGKYTFSYTTDTALPKGTYYVMVWLEDSQKTQTKYSIKGTLIS